MAVFPIVVDLDAEMGPRGDHVSPPDNLAGHVAEQCLPSRQRPVSPRRSARNATAAGHERPGGVHSSKCPRPRNAATIRTSAWDDRSSPRRTWFAEQPQCHPATRLGKAVPAGPELQPHGMRSAAGIAHENPSVGSQMLDGPGRTRRTCRSDVDRLAPGPTDPFDDRGDDRRRCQAASLATTAVGWLLPPGGQLQPARSPFSAGWQPAPVIRRANSIAILSARLGLRLLIATSPTPSA